MEAKTEESAVRKSNVIQCSLNTLIRPVLILQDIGSVVDGISSMKLSQDLVLGLPDFELIRVIGRGSYAKVLLVRLKKNDQMYAMKVVKKELVHDDEVRRSSVLS